MTHAGHNVPSIPADQRIGGRMGDACGDHPPRHHFNGCRGDACVAPTVRTPNAHLHPHRLRPRRAGDPGRETSRCPDWIPSNGDACGGHRLRLHFSGCRGDACVAPTVRTPTPISVRIGSDHRRPATPVARPPAVPTGSRARATRASPIHRGIAASSTTNRQIPKRVRQDRWSVFIPSVRWTGNVADSPGRPPSAPDSARYTRECDPKTWHPG